MGGSRSRALRKRASQSRSPLSVDLPALCADLHNSLQSISADPQLLSLLSSFPHSPSAICQDELGAAIHSYVLRYPPVSPSLRHRLAQACSALTHWHASSPSASLSALGALATASISPTNSHDSAALAASLAGIAAVARAALPSRPAREQVERHVPSLVEPVHVALFRSRSAPLADTTSDSGSGLHSDRDNLSSSAPRLHTVRYAALDALQALAAVASRALIPFWGMFLPDRDGVPRRSAPGRDTLASIMLFEKDMQLRSNAVSAVTALLASTRTFIQNATQLARPTGQKTTQAFTSISSRVLRASAALHTVVASALYVETTGVVVAKLAKLSSELASSMPVPAVPYEKIKIVVQALRTRLCDETTTDLTSRAAAASAIAVVLAKSGDHMSTAELEQLCEELVEMLRKHREGSDQPALELLGALRNAVLLRPSLFRRILQDLELPLMDLAFDESTPGQSLHCVRLVESFLAQTAHLYLGKSRDALTDDELRDLLLDIMMGWGLYPSLLKEIIQDDHHPAQASAISALGTILQLTEFDPSQSHKTNNASAKPGFVDLGKSETFVVKEAVGILKRVAASNRSDNVRICSLRSLANTPVKYVPKELLVEVLCQLDHEMRNGDNELSVRGKAMSSLSAFMENIFVAARESDQDLVSDLDSAARFAAEFLQQGKEETHNHKSSANRSVVESSDIAAVNLLACALRYPLTESVSVAESRKNVRDEHARAVSWVFMSDKSVNTKCVCCRAIGQILWAALEGGRVLTFASDAVLMEALERSLEHGALRLQLTSANVLRDVIVTKKWPRDVVQSVTRSVRVFEDACIDDKSKHVDRKERMQSSALQDILAETVFQTLRGNDQCLVQRLVESWSRSPNGLARAHRLLEAVFRYLSLPGLLTGHIKLTADGELTTDTKKEDARIFLQTLPVDSQEVVRQVLTIEKLLSKT